MAETKKAMPAGSSGWEPISASNVFTRTLKEGEEPKFKGTAGVSLVVQDFERAATFLDEKAYLLQWEENDILYQSPTLMSDDSTRARVSRFTVNNQSNTMGDAVKAALFQQKPPFMLRPRPGGKGEKYAQAWTTLLDVLLDRMKFRYWVGLGVEGQTLDGTAIWKGGWGTRERIVKKRKPKAKPVQIDQPAGNQETVHTVESDAFDVVPETVTESYPGIENRMLGTTLFDPGWRTPNDPSLCGYVVDVEYPTWADLDELRKQDCYDIPDSEVLKDFCFRRQNQDAEPGTTAEQNLSSQSSIVLHAESRASATSADPLSQPILMLERWDSGRCNAILRINETWIEIRADEHGMGRVPHFTANWRNIKNAGYGIGMGKLVGSDQRIEQGTLNHALNLLAYQFNPVILHLAGQNAPTQDRVIRAGGFVAVNSPTGDVNRGMAAMQMPSVPSEAWQMIQYAKTSSEETSGADSTFQQGNLGGKGSSAARTATGAGRIAAKSDGRVQTPVENIELGLFNPYLLLLIDMIKTYMPMKEIREILQNKMAADLMADFDGDDFIESDFEVEMLAASKLAAKAAMAQQLPFLMQIFQQPQLLEQLHNEGKTINLDVILDVLFQVSEFRMEDEIICQMDAKTLAMVQQSQNPQAGKSMAETQGKIAVETIRGQNAQELEDRKSQNHLATELALRATDHVAEQHMLTSGDPAENAVARTGGGLPLTRATGLALRADDEAVLEGKGASPLAGVD